MVVVVFIFIITLYWKRDSAKRDSAKRDSAKRDSAKRDSAKRDSAKRDSAKRDSAKQDSAKREDTVQFAFRIVQFLTFCSIIYSIANILYVPSSF